VGDVQSDELPFWRADCKSCRAEWTQKETIGYLKREKTVTHCAILGLQDASAFYTKGYSVSPLSDLQACRTSSGRARNDRKLAGHDRD
jgi:hypothetical protein